MRKCENVKMGKWGSCGDQEFIDEGRDVENHLIINNAII